MTRYDLMTNTSIAADKKLICEERRQIVMKCDKI